MLTAQMSQWIGCLPSARRASALDWRAAGWLIPPQALFLDYSYYDRPEPYDQFCRVRMREIAVGDRPC